MRNYLFLLKEVAWSAVLAVALAVLAIGTALFVPNSLELVIALGLSAVAFAGLAQRV